MAFRGAGDRDFVGELTDPLPLDPTTPAELALDVAVPDEP